MRPSISPDRDPRDRQHPDWARGLVELLGRTLQSPDPVSHERVVAILRAVVVPLAVITVSSALTVLVLVVVVN